MGLKNTIRNFFLTPLSRVRLENLHNNITEVFHERARDKDSDATNRDTYVVLNLRQTDKVQIVATLSEKSTKPREHHSR